LTSKMFRE